MKLLDELYSLSNIIKDKIILEDEINGYITYGDFEDKTGRVYNYLKSLSLDKDRIVAVRVKRSYRTYIAIIALLKAKIPYVIIGDSSPIEYVKAVYEECEPILTLNDEVLDEGVKYDYLKEYESRNNNDLAFVVYSTGSSGFFKGSMHEYGILEEYFESSYEGMKSHKDAQEALKEMSYFMLSGFYSISAILDIIDLIIYRTKLIIIKTENANNVDYLYNKAIEKNVYTMVSSPMTLPLFLNKPSSCIKEYFVCYEMFPCKYNKDYKIYNTYGLSEACGSLCFMEIDKDYDITPVGKPIKGKEVKLFNKDNKITSLNEIGELAFKPKYFRGYIKRMDLYNKAYHDGYFYTGDLGYYNENNDIVIIGRKNDIKETPNGYIVPIFITNAIKKEFPDIEKCYVKIFDDMVVAYYISNKRHTLKEINNKIKNIIPSYSLPTCIKKQKKFNYFFCGKINKNLFIKPKRK